MKRKKKNAAKNSSSKQLIERAGLAMKHGFYFEASLILSSVFERKLKKLMGKVENQAPRQGFTLEQSIKRVKYLHLSQKYPGLTANFSLGLIDNIRTWKNQRNEILKDIPDVHVSPARIERLANDAVKLSGELSKAVKTFKSARLKNEK